MIVWIYRAFGAAIIAGSLYVMGTGYAMSGQRDRLPDDVRNSPGAYRGYFILYGGK